MTELTGQAEPWNKELDMFGFITALYRKLEAALTREVKAADETARLREKYNDHVREQLTGMGVAIEDKSDGPKEITEVIEAEVIEEPTAKAKKARKPKAK